MSAETPRTPKLLPLPAGKTLQAYPLAPVDGFVLSRIDGTISDRDIIQLTGLPEDAVRASLGKLVELGLVAYGEPPAAPRAPAENNGKRSPSIPPRPIQEISEVQADGMPKPPLGLYDPSELDEDVDMEMDHRRKVLDLFYRLGELDHYEMLGVETGAPKKAIKKAYFELAALYHPDRFFRKRMGAFKVKMEAIFGRITDAHDVLTDKERRAEYDGYLAEQAQTRALEARMHAGMTRAEEPAPRTTSPPQGTPETPSPPPATSSAPPPRSSGVNLSEQARRDALARRLLGGRSSAAPRTPSTPSQPQADPDALRRHYELRVSQVKVRMARDHVEAARQAMASGDPVTAANAYRLAAQLNPEDEEVKAGLTESQAQANKVLADSYQKQAEYEEKNGRYADAARSWSRVTRAAPEDAVAHERAAFCMMKADGNLHDAASLAQRAIELTPDSAAYHTTLAQVYLAAGLQLNARRVLETAARLAPGDANIQTLLKRAGKP